MFSMKYVLQWRLQFPWISFGSGLPSGPMMRNTTDHKTFIFGRHFFFFFFFLFVYLSFLTPFSSFLYLQNNEARATPLVALVHGVRPS